MVERASFFCEEQKDFEKALEYAIHAEDLKKNILEEHDYSLYISRLRLSNLLLMVKQEVNTAFTILELIS